MAGRTTTGGRTRSRAGTTQRSARGSARKPPARRPARKPARRPARRSPDLLDRLIDGLGVVCLVLAVVMAAGAWWNAGGPVGRGLSTALGAVFGQVGTVMPVLVLIVGLVLMTTEPHHEGRPRIVVGL